jgi:hypothetical protein
MITYLHHSEVDKMKWDDCLDHSVNGIIYGYSWYLDVVAPGWDALVGDDYRSVFPLVHRSKFGIRYLCQPVFTQQLGLFSRELITPAEVDKFLGSIPPHFRFAEVNLNTLNKADPLTNSLVPLSNHELDLINTYEKIAGQYSENQKRNLKKARSQELTVFKQVRPEEVVRLFRENRGRRLAGLGDEEYRVLLQLVYLCMYKGMGEVYGVFDKENELCAGAIFVRSHRKAIFLFSAVNERARKTNAMSLLIDTYIRNNCPAHLTLDFEGSNDPDLARFYRSFGSQEVIYHRLVMNRLPFHLHAAMKLVKGVRPLFRYFS